MRTPVSRLIRLVLALSLLMAVIPLRASAVKACPNPPVNATSHAMACCKKMASASVRKCCSKPSKTASVIAKSSDCPCEIAPAPSPTPTTLLSGTGKTMPVVGAHIEPTVTTLADTKPVLQPGVIGSDSGPPRASPGNPIQGRAPPLPRA